MRYSNVVCLFVTCENFLKFSVNFSKGNTSHSKGEFIWKIKQSFVIFFCFITILSYFRGAGVFFTRGAKFKKRALCYVEKALPTKANFRSHAAI